MIKYPRWCVRSDAIATKIVSAAATAYGGIVISCACAAVYPSSLIIVGCPDYISKLQN